MRKIKAIVSIVTIIALSFALLGIVSANPASPDPSIPGIPTPGTSTPGTQIPPNDPAGIEMPGGYSSGLWVNPLPGNILPSAQAHADQVALGQQWWTFVVGIEYFGNITIPAQTLTIYVPGIQAGRSHTVLVGNHDGTSWTVVSRTATANSPIQIALPEFIGAIPVIIIENPAGGGGAAAARSPQTGQ